MIMNIIEQMGKIYKFSYIYDDSINNYLYYKEASCYHLVA